MKKTDRTVVIAGVKRAIFLGVDGQEYVEQDGDYILVRGAKVFKSETSRTWPTLEGTKDLADSTVRNVEGFTSLSQEEQEDALRSFFTGMLDLTQEREKELLNENEP